VKVVVGANANITLAGAASAAVLLNGWEGSQVNNLGVIDGSGGQGVAVASVVQNGSPTPFVVLNFAGAVLKGSIGTGGTQSSPFGVFVNNQQGALFETGKFIAVQTLDNAGTISVGAGGKIALTTITGDYVQHSTGNLIIDTDLATGKADMVTVGGKATIAGTVQVQPSSISNRSVTVLTAAGGLTIAPSLGSVRASQLFAFTPKVVGNSLLIQPEAHLNEAAAKLGGNQRSVAANLQQLFDGGANLDRGFTALSRIAEGPLYGIGLAKLSGQSLGALSATRFNSSHSFVANMYSGCASLDNPGVGADQVNCGWARVSGTDINQDDTVDAQGYGANTQTYQLGAQRQIGEHWYLSGSLAYEHSSFNSDDHAAKVHGDSVLAGTYLRYHQGPWQISTAADLGFGWYDSKRSVSVGDVSGIALSTPKEWHVGLHGKIAYELALGQGYLKPFVDAHAVYVHSNAYTETGLPVFNLAVESAGETAVAGALGLEAGLRVKFGDTASARLFTSAAYEALGNNDWATTARFSDQLSGPSFHSAVPAPDHLAKFAVGIDVLGAKNVDFSLQYSPEIGTGYVSHSGVARVAVRF
jgi:outer membrane autotransporter protein